MKLANFSFIGFASHNMGSTLQFLRIFPNFFILLFFLLADRPEFTTDVDVWRLERRGLVKGCAF